MTTLTPGQIVRFHTPEPDEQGLTFRVIEDRDTRVLLESCDYFGDWRIVPTFVYAKDDLEVVPANA